MRIKIAISNVIRVQAKQPVFYYNVIIIDIPRVKIYRFENTCSPDSFTRTCGHFWGDVLKHSNVRHWIHLGSKLHPIVLYPGD